MISLQKACEIALEGSEFNQITSACRFKDLYIFTVRDKREKETTDSGFVTVNKNTGELRYMHIAQFFEIDDQVTEIDISNIIGVA